MDTNKVIEILQGCSPTMCDECKNKYSCREAHYEAIQMIKALKDCRNELCLKCGRYKESYLGACRNCRWEEL